MATLGLAAVGSAIGGAISASTLASAGITGAAATGAYVTFAGVELGTLGAAVGGLAGGVVDSAFLAPLLFPTPKTGRGQIGETALSYTTEGAPTNLGMGSLCHMVPTVIWAGPRKIRKRRVGSGGKGTFFGGSANKRDVPFRSVALHIADLPKGTTAARVLKIFADGKLIWRDQSVSTQTVTSSSISATRVIATRGEPGGTTIFDVNTVYMDLRLPSSAGTDDDFRFFRAGNGAVVTVSGFSNSDNNTGSGTWASGAPVIETRSTSDGATHLRLLHSYFAGDRASVPSGAPDDEAAGQSVTIQQAKPKIDKYFDDIRIYLGNQTTPDSHIESFEGSGNVPPYKGSVIAVIEFMDLSEFGRVPSFEAIVEVDSSPYAVSSGIARLLDRAGYSSGEYDVTGVTAVDLRGYTVSGKQAVKTSLDPLMLYYNVIEQEIAGKLVYKDRPSATDITINSDDLAVSNGPDPFEISDGDDEAVPRTLTVSFRDSQKDMERGSVLELSRSQIGDQSASVEIDIAMTDAEARQTASRLLSEAHQHRQSVDFTLPPRYVYLRENDYVSLAGFGQTFSVQLSQVRLLADLSVRCSGVVREATSHRQVGQSPVFNEREIAMAGSVDFDVLDVGPLRSTDIGRPGFYYGTYQTSHEEPWSGASLFLSVDDVTYDQVAEDRFEAIAGEAVTVLGDGPVGVWDRGATVQVRLFSAENSLESKTEQEVLRGANFGYIGGELIAFQTATSLGDETYELKTLLRGLRNTEGATSNHAAGDRFVLLELGGPVKFLDRDTHDLGRQFYLKSLAPGELEANIEGRILQTPTAMLRPMPPSALRVARYGESTAGSGFHVLSWSRSSLGLLAAFQPSMRPSGDILYGDPPFLGQTAVPTNKNAFTIEVYDNSGAIISGRTTSQDSSTFIYTRSQQSTDGFTAGQTVTFRVYANGVNGLVSHPAIIQATTTV